MSSTSAAIQVTQFVRALALAWKNLAAYPPGHPLLVSSLHEVDQLLAELRGPAGEVVLGISADGLVYGDMKIDASAAQKLAQSLYQRGVALVRLASDTTTGDLEVFLRLLGGSSTDAARRPIWEELTAAGVTSINLQPVSYSAVRLTDDVSSERIDDPRSLWDEILSGLLANRRFTTAGAATSATSPDDLARLLSEYAAAGAPAASFDPEGTFGVRLHTTGDSQRSYTFLTTTIGERIASATGRKKQHSIEQAVQVLRSLAEPLRGAVLRGVLLGITGQEEDGVLLRSFAAEVPSGEVLDALRYLSSAGTLSSHATTLLQTLTGMDRAAAGGPSNAGLGDLITLFGEEDLSRFRAADHASLLASAAVRLPAVPSSPFHSLERLGERADTVATGALLRHFSELVVDLLAELGPSRSPEPVLHRLESMIAASLGAAEYDDARALIERLNTTADSTDSATLRAAIEAMFTRLAAVQTIQRLIDALQAAPPEKRDSLQQIILRLAGFGRASLLNALAEESNRSRRRRLFDFIVSLGPPMIPAIVAHLGDERWYVVRNMIALLRALQDRTSLPEIRKLAGHPDLRVRMEAIKSLLALDGSVPPDVVEDLFRDPDAKMVETAVHLVGAYGIREGVPPLLRILEGNDVLGKTRQLRIKALRALGDIADPAVLPALERFFKPSLLPWPARDERYVAWEALLKYPAEVRAALVEKGLRSSDPQVRAICARMVSS